MPLSQTAHRTDAAARDESPHELYQARIEAGDVRPDAAQARVVERLDRLAKELESSPAPPPPPSPSRPKGLLGRLGLTRSEPAPAAPPGPRGVYVYGPVGRGKSMVMDLFHECVAVDRKRRVHFHAFMQDVQERVHRRRQAGHSGDPVPDVAADIASETRLICFDEFQVEDITNAMILGRLFEALFGQGVVMVATSNSRPADLYKNGLQRDRFVPFIAVLERHMDVVELTSEHDYRLDRLKGRSVYHVPADDRARAELERAFADLTDDAEGHPVSLEVRGRTLEVGRAARGVAFVTFAEMCRRPLGPSDHLAIGRAFHTVILAGVPRMKAEARNEARRFVTLIDALYEHRVNLVCSADAMPDELLTEGLGAFEFRRTASRLTEMQAEDYIESSHRSAASP